MYCPVCKSEYRSGFLRCKDCEVDLVSELAEAAAASPEEDPAVLLEVATDPVTVSRITAGLEAEGIVHYVKRKLDELELYGMGLRIAAFQVFVRRRDANRATAIIQAVLLEGDSGTAPGVGGLRRELEGMEISALAPEMPEGWIPEEPTRDVWSGGDATRAEFLAVALRENSIPCRVVESGPEKQHLLVRPWDEARAKEIVRESLRGALPEEFR